MPQTATPVLVLLAPRDRYTLAELRAAQTLTAALHTCFDRGDLHLAPPRSAA